jgi:hypothetical protein
VTIAELFVNIGVKGADKTAAGVSKIGSGLKETASQGLAAKAAILGILYGVERLTASYGKQGANIMSASTALGESADVIGRWTKAGSMFNVSGEEVIGTMFGIKNAMVEMQKGKGGPEGFSIFAARTNLDLKRINDANYMLKKLQEFAKIGDPNLVRSLMKGYGISDNMFAFLRRYTGDVDKITGGFMGEKQARNMERINQQWTKFWNNLNMKGMSLAGSYGPGAIKEIEHVVSGVERLMKLLDQFAGKQGVFIAALTAIGIALYAAFGPLGPILAGLGIALAELDKYSKGQKSMFDIDHKAANGKNKEWGSSTGGNPMERLMNYLSGDDIHRDIQRAVNWGTGDDWANLAAPAKPSIFGPSSGGAVSAQVNQNFYGVSPDNPAAVGRASRTGVSEAFNQIATKGVRK